MHHFPIHVRVFQTRVTSASCTRHDFVVCDDSIELASKALVGFLEVARSVFINDHRRDDAEGGVIFERSNGVLRRMAGGHGYSSGWSTVTEALAEVEITATLRATKFGPKNGGGHFEILDSSE